MIAMKVRLAITLTLTVLYLLPFAARAQEALDAQQQYLSDMQQFQAGRTERFNATLKSANQAQMTSDSWSAIAPGAAEDLQRYRQVMNTAIVWTRYRFELWEYYAHTNIAALEALRDKYEDHPGIQRAIDQSLADAQQQLLGYTADKNRHVTHLMAVRDGQPARAEPYTHCAPTLLGIESGCVNLPPEE